MSELYGPVQKNVQQTVCIEDGTKRFCETLKDEQKQLVVVLNIVS